MQVIHFTKNELNLHAQRNSNHLSNGDEGNEGEQTSFSASFDDILVVIRISFANFSNSHPELPRQTYGSKRLEFFVQNFNVIHLGNQKLECVDKASLKTIRYFKLYSEYHVLSVPSTYQQQIFKSLLVICNNISNLLKVLEPYYPNTQKWTLKRRRSRIMPSYMHRKRK